MQRFGDNGSIPNAFSSSPHLVVDTVLHEGQLDVIMKKVSICDVNQIPKHARWHMFLGSLVQSVIRFSV